MRCRTAGACASCATLPPQRPGPARAEPGLGDRRRRFDGLRRLEVEAVPPRFEDGFMMLLRTRTDRERARVIAIAHPLARREGEAAVRVRQLVKKFGAFTAVDRHQLRGAPRTDLRAARTQRRRQDHDIPHAVRLAGTERRSNCTWPAPTCAAPPPRPAPGSATWRRSSRSMAR